MKRVAFIAAPIALFCLIACNNGRAYNPDTRIETAQSGAAQTASPTDTSHPAGVVPVPGSEAKTGGAINPAHGQPGHRCDVAVGAPIPPDYKAPNAGIPNLNNPAVTPISLSPTPQTGAPATQTPTATNSFPSPVPAQTAAPTGKGLNPAHGQPGHRCDIAVGAPLDSKPAAAPAATTTTTPAAQPGSITTVPQPVSVNPSPAPQKVAAGMNPAHGQPGHRCDLAVGAPLNSKPAATTAPVTPLLPPAKPDSGKNK